MTQSQFRQFETDWKVYKQLLRLQPQQLVSYLYNACNDAVRNTITNSHPNFLNQTEEEALKTVKLIVTRNVRPGVHRKTFIKIEQGDTQSIKDFVNTPEYAPLCCC